MRRIEHKNKEGKVVAEGGTLDETVVFYRDKAELTVDHKLTIPSSKGTFKFEKDPKDSISVSMDEIETFTVGPIFHKPSDIDSKNDKMVDLLKEYSVVVIATLIDKNNDKHFLHYVQSDTPL